MSPPAMAILIPYTIKQCRKGHEPGFSARSNDQYRADFGSQNS